MNAGSISKFGRVTKGVRLMRLSDDVKIVGMARAERTEEIDESGEAEETEEKE